MLPQMLKMAASMTLTEHHPAAHHLPTSTQMASKIRQSPSILTIATMLMMVMAAGAMATQVAITMVCALQHQV